MLNKIFIYLFFAFIFLASAFNCQKKFNEKLAPNYHLNTKPKKFIDDLVSGSQGRLSAITIFSKDSILHSDFYGKQSINDKYYIQSVSKSIISVVAYIAIKEGYFRYDQCIADFFPDYAFQIKNTEFEKVKISDLLNMKSGIVWNEDTRPEKLNPTYLLGKSEDPIKHIFNQKINSPSVKFNYCCADVALLCEIMERSIGHPLNEYILEKLFFPLKMYDSSFQKLSNGKFNYWGGMILSTKSLILFSQAVLRKGYNQNSSVQVIPTEWLNKMNNIHVASTGIKGYMDVICYSDLWYGATLASTNRICALKLLCANGFGNNHIVLIPELQVGIVIIGNSDFYEKPFYFDYIGFVKGLTEMNNQ